MKKFVVALCAVFIGVFAIFSGLAPVFAYADSSTTYAVNFVAPDNTIFYSIDVDENSTLGDLVNSNLALNPLFLIPDSNSDTGVMYWSENRTTTTSSIRPYYGLSVSGTTRADGVRCIYNTSDSAQFLNQTVTLSFKVSNVVGGVRAWLRNGNWATFGYVDTTTDGIFSVTANVTSLGNSGQFVVYFSFENMPSNGNYSCVIDWVKVEIGSTPTAFFMQEYLNALYRLSGSYVSNYIFDIDYTHHVNNVEYIFPVFSKFTGEYWNDFSWSNFNFINGIDVWTDGQNYYYSVGTGTQFVLNVQTYSSSSIVFDGYNGIYGRSVWTDGYKIFYSGLGGLNYYFDVRSNSWNSYTFTAGSGVTLGYIDGQDIWTIDGQTYFFSSGSTQYYLIAGQSQWFTKTWNGLTSFVGSNVWTDGQNVYYSSGSTQYVLDPLTSTWSVMTWNGLTSFDGNYVWTDGQNVYYSGGSSSTQYVLDTTTSTWYVKTWYGYSAPYGNYIWNNGVYIFYSFYSSSYGNYQYILNDSYGSNNNGYYYNVGFDSGYTNGYADGSSDGYNSGYSKGVSSASNFTFFSLIGSIVDAPIQYMTSLFNWNLLGVNLWSLFTGLLTLAVIIFIVKLCLGGK